MNFSFSQLNSTAQVLLSLSLILFAGFLATRITKRLLLPNVTGYILAGILIGPSVLGLVPVQLIDSMSFFSDIVLGFIAFGVGEYFGRDALKQTGVSVLLITVGEALFASAAVSLCMYYIFRLDFQFSLLLGVIAAATAPAGTMMTIRQYHAKGVFINNLLQVIAFDNVVSLLAFSVVTAVISASASGTVKASDILMPLVCNAIALIVGALFGFLLSKLITPGRSRDNRLILTVAMLFTLCGICAAMDISPLLSCMIFSAVYINLTGDNRLYGQLNAFSPPILSIFFVVSGMNLNLSTLKNVGIIGITYFAVRIIAKYLGAYGAAALVRADKTVRNYLGLALIPQAGVAIGLAFLGERMLPSDKGDLLLTIILASSVLYELVGPACAKGALFMSGSIPKSEE